MKTLLIILIVLVGVAGAGIWYSNITGHGIPGFLAPIASLRGPSKEQLVAICRRDTLGKPELIVFMDDYFDSCMETKGFHKSTDPKCRSSGSLLAMIGTIARDATKRKQLEGILLNCYQ